LDTSSELPAKLDATIENVAKEFAGIIEAQPMTQFQEHGERDGRFRTQDRLHERSADAAPSREVGLSQAAGGHP